MSTAVFEKQESELIRIRGARVHNLQNIDIDIPRNKLVVLTGLSGSGKSSLAFDTLYAEGQRQYIESLSVYSRQFFDQLERPNVDEIAGLQPTLCIDQRPGNQNPRSTVATATEIYDYLRLLMARLGIVHCHQCGGPIHQQTEQQISETLMQFPEGTKTMVIAPIVHQRRGKHEDCFAEIRKAGFVRARVDGHVYDIDNLPDISARKQHSIDAIVDRIIIRPGIEGRLAESIQMAVKHGSGTMVACYLPPQQDPKSVDAVWEERLFSTRYACPTCEISYESIEPRSFSFNSPQGACPVCEGLGNRVAFDPDMVFPNRNLSLTQDAIAPWKGASAAQTKKRQNWLHGFLEKHGLDWNTNWANVDDPVFEQLLHGDNDEFVGILIQLEKELVTTTRKKQRQRLESFRPKLTCSACQGTRLRGEARAVKLGGKGIDEINNLSIRDGRSFFENLSFCPQELKIAGPLVAEITRRLRFLEEVGVPYLALGRSADTLSGGEMQRVRLASSIGSGLVGVCYILDEPSIGLHPRDNSRLIQSLRKLQQQGNTVLVVEHDEAVMREADFLIDIGPSAGSAGGRVMSIGKPTEVAADPQSVTGRYLAGLEQIPIPKQRRRVNRTRSLLISKARTHNLQGVDVRFPLGVLVCLTGVSGSGKSSLLNETLAPAISRRLGTTTVRPGPHESLRGVSQIDKLVAIDQSPIGRTPRSSPITYTGIFDEIRKVFKGTREARQRGYSSGRFSFNLKGGRCEDCQGHGLQKIEMNFLPDLFVSCATCRGARFNRQTLQIRYRGKSIAEVLELRIEEAVEYFENHPAIHRVLQSLDDIGLGYLPLGQPSTTLSGGEAQRIKLATQLSRVETGNTLYLLDEPTTGLHFEDIKKLLHVLNQLVDKGNTVIVIEHNLDVIKSADWLIDLGPEGGSDGGHVVAEGTPEEVAADTRSYTGQFLASLLNGRS